MQRVLETVARVSLTMRAGRHSPQDAGFRLAKTQEERSGWRRRSAFL